MAKSVPDPEQIEHLLVEVLEAELACAQVYEIALRSAANEDLRNDWLQQYDRTVRHVRMVRGILDVLSIDPSRSSVARVTVRELGEAMVSAIHAAQEGRDIFAAQLVAAQCVLLVETKVSAMWNLVELVAAKGEHEAMPLLRAICTRVARHSKARLYTSEGWWRELWIDALALPAALPPPE